MRKLVALAVVVAVLAALAVGDIIVRHTVERDIASGIERSVPGTTAKVQISSFPFVGRIAAAGTVPSLRVEITGVKVGTYPVDSVQIVVKDLKMSRSELLHGRAVLRSIGSAAVTGTISQRSVDIGSGLPVTLGDGTVGLAGVQGQARISVAGGNLIIGVAPLPAITLPLLPAAILPCSAAAVITAGRITLSCTTSTIPPALLSAAGAQ